MLSVLFMNLLYAIGYPMSKVALTIGSPLFLTAMRMLIGGVALLGIQYYLDPQKLRVPRVFMRQLFLSGLFNMYLTNVFEMYSIMHMDPAKVAFIYNLSPFIAAFFGFLFFKEKLSSYQWLALVIAFFGSLIIVSGSSPEELLTPQIGFLSWAEGSMFIAATTTVYGCILVQQLIRAGCGSLIVNALSMLFGGVMALIHSLLSEPWNPIPSSDPLRFFGWVFLMIVLYNFISYELYNRLARYYSVTFLTLSWFTTPLFTVFFDWLWLGTMVSWEFWPASLLIMLGLYLFYKDELKKALLARP